MQDVLNNSLITTLKADISRYEAKLEELQSRFGDAHPQVIETKATLDSEELKHVVARFRHEAQAVGRLVHPRIVQIYDYGEDDEVAYIVMELVNGKPLSEHLAQETSYEIREVGEIIRQLLDGIGHAHAERVIHRDIKPSNILVNSDGRIKLSDFGIARIESSNLTQVGDVLGTPHYMAPEQFLGAEIDTQADLYSVGVIAYELLTGRKPFTGNTAAVMQAALNQDPELPSHLQPKLSPLMDQVLLKAMAKKAANRYRNAHEFSEAFREAINASLGVTGNNTVPGMLDTSALMNAARIAGCCAFNSSRSVMPSAGCITTSVISKSTPPSIITCSWAFCAPAARSS